MKKFLFSKIIFVTSFLLLILIGCQDNSVEPFNYERDTPLWLKEKIDSMSNNQYYWGAKVFRYGWEGKYVYHIFIPISSCAYCEVYDQLGNKIQLANDRMAQDYIYNRKNEILVWECNVYWGEAIIIWQGEYAVDGCGFFVEIENKRYKPENESFIGDEFKTDTTIVLIHLIYLNRKLEYWCGDAPYVMEKDGIKILSIERI